MDEMNQNTNMPVNGGFNNNMPPQEPKGGAGLGIASMVLGIVSLVLFCLPYICFPGGIISIILGGVNLAKKNPGKGMAIAGIVCSIIAIAIYIICIAIVGSVGTSILEEFE